MNHGKLLKQMWTLGIRDKKLLSIISAMMKAEVAGIGFPEKGTPQGGIISPLLSNIVLNELDWWIASQWETIPTRKEHKGKTLKTGTVDRSRVYEVLRRSSNLKECFVVRYADDFKIFCRYKNEAKRLYRATQMWLKERLGLEISEEKSKIVNLKKNYSEFLGFKIKAHRKGNNRSGKSRYTVKSNVSDKALSKIKEKAKEQIKLIRTPKNLKEEAEAEFLAEVVDKVYYFPMYKNEPQLSENIEIVREVPKKIFGTDLVEGLQTNKGEWKVDGIFVLRESISPEQLLDGVELDGVHVKVNLKMETSISGCYACGDITGMPYQYIKAAGQGNVAALSAVEYLAKNKEKKVE